MTETSQIKHELRHLTPTGVDACEQVVRYHCGDIYCINAVQ